jgi:hypothetical protein
MDGLEETTKTPVGTAGLPPWDSDPSTSRMQSKSSANETKLFPFENSNRGLWYYNKSFLI